MADNQNNMMDEVSGDLGQAKNAFRAGQNMYNAGKNAANFLNGNKSNKNGNKDKKDNKNSKDKGNDSKGENGGKKGQDSNKSGSGTDKLGKGSGQGGSAEKLKQAQDMAKKVKEARETAINAGQALMGDPVALAKLAGKLIKTVAEKMKDPETGMKMVTVALIFLGGPFFSLMMLAWILTSWMNPFTATNSVIGDNEEALQADIGKDKAFLSSQGISAEELTEETALEYRVEDNYDRMAGIIHDAVDAGYEVCLAQYPAGKAQAKNSVTVTHDNASVVYLYDGKYWGEMGNLEQKNKNPDPKDEKELEGDAWDDTDYFTDYSNNGAMSSGTAYIIGAYAVSKGNSAPVELEGNYTYTDALEELLNKHSTQLGFFDYQGSKVSEQVTQTVGVREVVQETRYELKESGSAIYCAACTAALGYTYTEEGQNNSSCKGTQKTGTANTYDYVCSYGHSSSYYDYGCSAYGCSELTTQYYSYYYGYYYICDAETPHEEYDAEKVCVYCSRSVWKDYDTYTYYTCSKGHVWNSTNTSTSNGGKANTTSGVKYKEASPYQVWVAKPAENKEFTYNVHSYKGTLSPFSYDKLIQEMFLDNNPFYEDVQGAMAAGTYQGNAATITAGESITLPSGLGGSFSYMAWQMITANGTQQMKLKQESGMPFDSEGFGRINGRYVIACTTTFGQVGDYVDFYQSDGNIIKCIIGDIKNQNDAGCTQWGHNNGNVVVEFIVDQNSWYNKKDNVGTPSNHPELGGKTIVKAVNGGSWFDNPDFVQSLSGQEPGSDSPAGSTTSSDAQLLVANLAVQSLVSNKSTFPPTANYCAAWVSGLYEAAGVCKPSGNAIDYWTQWKDSGSSDPTNIPVGAAVVGSGSSSEMGRRYGHVGIYVGDTDGDGEGEVVDNIGRITISSLSKWLSWQTTPVTPSYGGSYGPGFVGWVWPCGLKLGDGMDYTGVDPSSLVYYTADSGSLSREQRLANIMASPYYQWGVYYEYKCDHPKSLETKCPECDAEMKTKQKGFLWWKSVVPIYEYRKADEPDSHIVDQVANNGRIERTTKPFSVSEKIDWYVENMLNTIETAAQYEAGAGPGGFSSLYTGSGNTTIVEEALKRVGNGGQESWNYAGFEGHWCAMFVSMCAAQCGFEPDIIQKFWGCVNGRQWFKNKGLYQDRTSGYEPKPGDIIFYDWDGDGSSDHVAIVEKSEGGRVYTIGGNEGGSGSGSAFYHSSRVKQSSRLLTDSNIMGYGTPEYPSSELIGGSDPEKVKNFLLAQGLTNSGAAGLMGNLWAESNICSIRLQGDFSSGYATSVDYTKKVDNGTISKSAFVNNGPNGGGYGLAQWTYYTRKQALYEYAKSKNASIGDLQMQLEFLMMELSSSYPSVLAVLRTSNDVGACAEVVLLKFERPANMHSKIGERTGFARKYL